jgi:DNA-binding response OmpR family regulator
MSATDLTALEKLSRDWLPTCFVQFNFIAMPKSKELHSKKILVVEDDSDILNVLNIILGLEGYEVEVLSDGKPILENRSTLPDLYILDKTLPQIDGVDVCRHIKSHPRTKNIPVIMISGSPNFGRAALEAGATMFVEKPFRMHSLLNTIASALQIHARNKWFTL